MNLLTQQNLRLFGFYLVLIVFCCFPIFWVDIYINQDGAPHLYNAYIILQLLKDNPSFIDLYALNAIPIPNLSGHWLLALLLMFFSPFLVNKILAAFCFAGFVAAAGWLRFQVAGREGINTALILSTALSFNWMWFLGFYNFIIGVIGFTFALGLYWRWRENLNFKRALTLSILIIFVFLSHLISFGMLFSSLFLLSVFVSNKKLKSSFVWTCVAFLPVLPFIIVYKLATETGGHISPVWRYLDNPLSITNWVLQLQAADPFQMLSRKAFPFVGFDSSLFAIFSSSLWLFVALFCLSLLAWFSSQKREFLSKQYLPFTILTISSVFFWIFAPDDFGKSHGSFLRERVLLCGLICFIPLFKTFTKSKSLALLSLISKICLVFIIIFQTAVLWEYALNADKLGREYLSGKNEIKDSDTFASVILIENGCRYKSSPLTNINLLYGFGKNTVIWDNYELGYYLFPVVAVNSADKRFIYDFRESNAFELCDKNEKFEEKLFKLNSILDSNNEKIQVMLVWNEDLRVQSILNKWYEDKPFFQNGRVKLFRHK